MQEVGREEAMSLLFNSCATVAKALETSEMIMSPHCSDEGLPGVHSTGTKLFWAKVLRNEETSSTWMELVVQGKSSPFIFHKVGICWLTIFVAVLLWKEWTTHRMWFADIVWTLIWPLYCADSPTHTSVCVICVLWWYCTNCGPLCWCQFELAFVKCVHGLFVNASLCIKNTFFF